MNFEKKEPVQEFFEYITILLDKPFQNGQFIHIDDIWAKVERVGVDMLEVLTSSLKPLYQAANSFNE